MRINSSSNNFKGLSKVIEPLSAFHNPNATIPTLIIETGVTLGRAKEASKRGGKVEATDRLVEQGISAVVWIWGVQALKKLGDLFGEKILGIKNLNFDVGSDILRDPMKNLNIGLKEKTFKIANILTSTALATMFIGFALPKINNKILKKIAKSEDKKSQQEQKQNQIVQKPISLEEFKNSTNRKNISFTSALDKATFLAHTLENNQTARLLITDSGVVAGRCYNAKNKYRKIENLFRDISSIYFYLFSTGHFVKMMGKLTNTPDVNPKALKETSQMLIKRIENSKGIDVHNFKRNALGEVGVINLRKLDKLFEDKEVISFKEFIDVFGEKFEIKAKKMSELQPVFEEKRFLTKMQAHDVLSKGWISDPEFLFNALSKATNEKSSKKEKFISKKTLEKIRTSLDDFVTQIEQYAKRKNKKIDKELIENVANKIAIKNFAFYSLGTAISIFALGTLIPKVQYFITRKLTNEDKFPELEEIKKG